MSYFDSKNVGFVIRVTLLIVSIGIIVDICMSIKLTTTILRGIVTKEKELEISHQQPRQLIERTFLKSLMAILLCKTIVGAVSALAGAFSTIEFNKVSLCAFNFFSFVNIIFSIVFYFKIMQFFI